VDVAVEQQQQQQQPVLDIFHPVPPGYLNVKKLANPFMTLAPSLH